MGNVELAKGQPVTNVRPGYILDQSQADAFLSGEPLLSGGNEHRHVNQWHDASAH
jgi:hypothetical protein